MFNPIFLEKIILGVTLAAPIGPVSIEMIRRGLQNGFWSAMNIRIGSTMGHIVCLCVAYYALSAFQVNQRAIGFLAILGSVFLIYMGIKNIVSAVELDTPQPETITSSLISSLWLGFVLAFVNPVSVVFWVGVFATSMIHAASTGFISNLLIMVGVLMWGVLLCTVLTFSKKVFPKGLIKIIAFFANIAMIVFGVKYGYQALLTI